MSRSRFLVAIFLLASISATTSCWPFKKSKPKPVPTAPRPTPAQIEPAPQPLPPPPELAPKEPPTKAPEGVPEQPPSLPPPPSKKRPSALGPPVQSQAPSATPPSTPAPAPQLRPILGAQQRQEFEGLIRERVARARQALSAVRGKSLSRSQRTVVGQIETFIRQAEQARSDDLIRAGNLAERADVLAKDLMQSIR